MPKESRNSNGRTAQEEADFQQTGNTPTDPAPAGTSPSPALEGGVKGPMVPQRPAPANIHPSAKGVYGAPIGDTVLK